tara:strand:+ start:790 stop:1365 length:576 start_codon:yes stop_codon:yes gene_type:complete
VPNKIHKIVEGIEEMQTVNAEHTFRVGLIANTIVNARPVYVEDIDSILKDVKSLDISSIRGEFPILVEFVKGIQVSILLVADKDSNEVQCYPCSRNAEDNIWIPYDIAFIIEQDDILQLRAINSWAVHDVPSQLVIDHMEALATMVRSFLYALTSDSVEIYDLGEDHTVINKKRVSSGKMPIVNTYGIKQK